MEEIINPGDFSALVNKIVKFTTLFKPKVEERIWMEALQLGDNIRQEVVYLGVNPNKTLENVATLSRGLRFYI